MAGVKKAHWIANPAYDSTWIIGPHFASVLLVFCWSRWAGGASSLPLWGWLVAVLFVDVAHVYATLFRTYLHREGRERWSFLLTALPLAVFVLGFLVFRAGGPLAFWRILAYIAAYHFIRQQYGFFKIYVRDDNSVAAKKKLDEIFLYSLMVLPMIYWHTHLPRDFEWFVPGDFYALAQGLWLPSLAVFFALTAAYIISELYFIFKKKTFNLPKNLLFFATGFSWMVGIIYFNGDFAFTITNTLSHGIPYMALVAWTTRKQSFGSREGLRTWLQRSFALSVFLALLLIWSLAFMEEGLWDTFVWHEREFLFRPLSFFSRLGGGFGTSFWVALLSVPQITHYFLDGFIWKIRKPQSDLAAALRRS